MSLSEVIGALDDWSARDMSAGVATLVSVRRSAPRAPGARMAVSEDGAVAGSISSGCVESDLFERLQEVIADARPRLTEYGISDEMAAGVGLPCGGEIEVLLTRHDATDPVWPPLREAVTAGQPAVLLIGLGGEGRGALPAGRMQLVLPDSGPIGSLGTDELEQETEAAIASLFDHGGTAVLELSGHRLFAEAFLPPPRLAIVGASPIAEALCQLAAWASIDVTVIDPRTALAGAERFPEATRVLTEWPEEGLARVGLDRWLSVVVLSHDEKLDVPALAAALRAGCLYIGLLGGRKTQRTRRDALAQLGFGREHTDRIHGPVGLQIGARGPREIALSIMSELVAVHNGGSAAARS